MTDYIVVEVEWLDAHGGNESWTPPADIEHSPRVVHSVGWLVKRDETGFSLAQSQDTDLGALDAHLFIPLANVRKWCRLSPPEPPSANAQVLHPDLRVMESA